MQPTNGTDSQPTENQNQQRQQRTPPPPQPLPLPQHWMPMQYPATAMVMPHHMLPPQHYVPPPPPYIPYHQYQQQHAPHAHHWMDENYLHRGFVSTAECGRYLRKSTNKQTDVTLSIAKHVLLKQSLAGSKKRKRESNDENIIFSPLSLQVALSIVAAGSEGPTQQQLLSFLRSNSIDNLNSIASQLVSVVLTDAAPTGGPRLSFANGVWVEQSLSLHPSFKQVMASDYKAKLASVDFQTRAIEATNEVNLWVQNEIRGLIKKLLPLGSVDSTTRLIFANALYFKGAWTEKFDTSKTKDYDFHLLNGTSVKVPFMTSKKMQFISVFDSFKVLGLPYRQGLGLPYTQGKDKRQFSMYFFLPKAKDGLSALVEQVASESGFLERILPFEEVLVGDFRIPRFKISFGLETSDVLKELGVVLPFSPGGLTKIVDSPMGQELYISKVFHKSFIEVNEEGTEAAAATAMVGAMMCSAGYVPPPRIDFVADHPFLFLIRENLTGTILFIGQVCNPLGE